MTVNFHYFNDITTNPVLSIVWERDGLVQPPAVSFRTTGTLRDLLLAYLVLSNGLIVPATPAGIWIDRLEEYPEELAGATPEQVNAILLHLRQRHPNGV